MGQKGIAQRNRTRGGLAYNLRSNPEANFVQKRGGGAERLRESESFQEQQQAKQLHDKSKAYSDGNTKARTDQENEVNGDAL